MLRAAALTIVLAGVAAYWNGLSTPFMFDDDTAIVNNQQVHQLSPLSEALSPPADTPVARRPLANLTLALNYAAGELAPRGYHVVNLTIHLVVALLLFGVVRRTLRGPMFTGKGVTGMRASLAGDAAPIAWACALVWTVHPLNSEVIQYVTQRTESLMALFYLLTLYCAIRAFETRPRHGKWTAAAVAACAAGMACKESMITAPVIVALYDRVFLFDSARAAWKRRRGLYLGLGATWLVLAALMAGPGRTSAGLSSGTSPWVYLLNQAQIVTQYLKLSVWPRELVLDYGLPQALTVTDVILPASFLVALVIVVALALVYAPPLGFLGAWFFITLAPTSSIVPISTEVGAERRMYLALAALVVLGVVAVYMLAWRVAGRRAVYVTVAAAASVAVVATAGTMARNREYVSRMSIARTIVDRWPSGRTRFILGVELLSAGQHDEGMRQFRESTRDYPPGHYGLGVEYAAAGEFDQAVDELNTFIRLRPEDPVVVPARDLLGRIFMARGQFAEAEDQFNLILQRQPMNSRARQNLAAIRSRARPN